MVGYYSEVSSLGIDMTVSALLKPDGFLTPDRKEKVTLFTVVFERKQSNDKPTMPRLIFLKLN